MTEEIIALTRKPSSRLASCELTFLSRTVIDSNKAQSQHRDYCQLLQNCGARVIALPAADELADGVFVEDTALVLDEVAILLRMGTPSREPETALMERELLGYRQVLRLETPCRLEGGDILQVGKRLFIGRTTRSNDQGIKALASLVQPFGYRVTTVEVRDCLHLKTGCTALDDSTMLLNPTWVSPAALSGFRCLNVAADEPFAANIIRIGDKILMAAGQPATERRLMKLGYSVATVDISELMKAEAGLTCMSILFKQVRCQQTQSQPRE